MEIISYKATSIQILKSVLFIRPCFVYIKHGSKIIYSNSGDRILSKGSIILIPANTTLHFSNIPDKNGKFLSHQINFIKKPSNIRNTFLEDCDKDIFKPSNYFSSLIELICNHQDDITKESCSMLEDLFLQYLNENGLLYKLFIDYKSDFKINLINFLTLNLSSNLSASCVSRSLNMSRATFFRKLKDEGIIYVDLLEKLRLNYALSLIQSSSNDMSMPDIANSCGYSTQRFRYLFKDRFGITPCQYKATIN